MTTPQGRPTSALNQLQWITSTRSQSGGGQCVEVGPFSDGTGRVAVRHSRHPDGSTIIYSREEWTAFLAGAKDGEFDF